MNLRIWGDDDVVTGDVRYEVGFNEEGCDWLKKLIRIVIGNVEAECIITNWLIVHEVDDIKDVIKVYIEIKTA